MLIEVRDTSGTLHKAEFEVMTLPSAVLPAVGLGGAVALVGAILAIRWGGFGGWTIGIIAALIALAGLGMFGFLMWGHYAGYSWHFA